MGLQIAGVAEAMAAGAGLGAGDVGRLLRSAPWLLLLDVEREVREGQRAARADGRGGGGRERPGQRRRAGLCRSCG